MAVPEVNKKFLSELEGMGFPLVQATRALHYSGNSSLEDAINWIIDHENDPEIDQMPLIPVNINIVGCESFSVSEKVKLEAQKMRGSSRRRKEGEERKLEREREKKRIQAGKELLEAKSVAEENERKRSLALRIAEKDEEKRARERIRHKLQQDKIERRQRPVIPPEDPVSSKPAAHAIQHMMERFHAKSAQMSSSMKAEILRDCLRSLRQNNKDDDVKVKRAFHTLLIYVRNIARNPDEEKFRTIRISNPVFQDRVGVFEEGINFLELCGFERIEGDKFLYLPRGKVDMAVFSSAERELQSAISNPFFGLLSR